MKPGKLPAFALAATAMSGLLVSAPAAEAAQAAPLADTCHNVVSGWYCDKRISSQEVIRIRLHNGYMQAEDVGHSSWNRPVHLDRTAGGSGWEGPLGPGNYTSQLLPREHYVWRGCVRLSPNNYACTDFH